MLQQTFQLMLYGLGGVFGALAILYAIIKIIGKVFPPQDKT